MTTVLDDIERDHANMRRLLNLLEDELENYAEGAETDWETVESIAIYFTDFPDACHHPKEDAIAAVMLERDAERAAPLRGLAAQHEELGALARRFAQAVEDVLAEAELSREYFERVAGEFIGSQRHHMDMEERHFLPLAREMMSEGDVAELGMEAADPLFGAMPATSFEKLLETLLDREAAASKRTAQPGRP